VTIIAAYVASALLVLAWLTYTIHVTLVENEEAAAGHDDPQRTSQLIRVSFFVFVVPVGTLTTNADRLSWCTALHEHRIFHKPSLALHKLVGTYTTKVLLEHCNRPFCLGVNSQCTRFDHPASTLIAQGASQSDHHVWYCLQALNLWLQYTTLLGGINVPAPKSVHWVFNAAQFAFATVTSGSLSTDCLLTGSMNAALQRIFISLAVPVIMLAALVGIQVLR